MGVRGESPMTPLTVLDKVVEALQAAGATEEMITAAVKAGGEFGESRTPQVECPAPARAHSTSSVLTPACVGQSTYL